MIVALTYRLARDLYLVFEIFVMAWLIGFLRLVSLSGAPQMIGRVIRWWRR